MDERWEDRSWDEEIMTEEEEQALAERELLELAMDRLLNTSCGLVPRSVPLEDAESVGRAARSLVKKGFCKWVPWRGGLRLRITIKGQYEVDPDEKYDRLLNEHEAQLDARYGFDRAATAEVRWDGSWRKRRN